MDRKEEEKDKKPPQVTKKKFSQPDTRPRYSFNTKKKFSLASSLSPPVLHEVRFGSRQDEDDQLRRLDDEVDEVTRSLETAVRKMSRGSPNPRTTSPNVLWDLSGMAKGYEQYRESLTFMRHTTEYGEASSDDLSSEWDDSDAENNNNVSSANAIRAFKSLALRKEQQQQIRAKSPIVEKKELEEKDEEEQEEPSTSRVKYRVRSNKKHISN